jgi:DNA-nicking Smr family endonuclease
MRPPKHPAPEESAAFREAVKDVKPLAARAPPTPPRPPARARFRRLDERQVLAESLELAPGDLNVETGDELLFRRAHLPKRLTDRLKRGEFAVGDEIDLHGLSAVAARAALREFLAQAVRRRLGCVRVVHGKGLRSGPQGPVLKHAVNRWLPKVEAVLAFVSTPARDGGTGALYVLLAR